MNLKTTPVNQCLDKCLLIFGYEIPELLAVFFLLALLNFVFGQTNLKLFLVWLPVVVLAIVLRVTKRGKPDNYLVHLVRYKLQPPLLSAFSESETFKTPPTHFRRGRTS